MRVDWVRLPNMFLAAIFLGAGFSALLGQEQMRDIFHAWGYPDWFRATVGFIQATAGGCLLIPRAVPAAAAVLAAIMVGAIVTHLRSGEAAFAGIPILVLAALAYVGVNSWRNRAKA